MPKNDFAHIRAREPKKDAWFEFDEDDIQGGPFTANERRSGPRIHVRRADESNPGYYNAMSKSRMKSRRKLAQGKLTADMLNTYRSEDRKLFPIHVIIGWDKVIFTSGQPVEYTPENVHNFITSLPDDLMDELRDFAANPRSFVADDESGPIMAEEVEATGKS